MFSQKEKNKIKQKKYRYNLVMRFEKLDSEMKVIMLNNYAMNMKLDEVLRLMIQKYKGEKK